MLTHARTRRTLTYGQVAAQAAGVRLDGEPAPKPPQDWWFLGKANPSRVQQPSVVTGSAVFGIDVKVPGMVHAALMQSPVHGGRLKSYDFEKIRNHYGVSRMAQIAGVEALADQDYLNSVAARVAAGRRRISAIAEQNGLKPLPSATNFVTMDCGRDGAFALKMLQALLSRDVFIRKPMAPRLDRCIRVSVGLDHELDIFAEELPGALAAARGN